MWVINNEKEQNKIYIRNDIQSLITNIMHESNEIHNIISAVSGVTGGASSGVDIQLTGNCRQALQNLSVALQNLAVCQNYVELLDTREWINDEQY